MRGAVSDEVIAALIERYERERRTKGEKFDFRGAIRKILIGRASQELADAYVWGEFLDHSTAGDWEKGFYMVVHFEWSSGNRRHTYTSMLDQEFLMDGPIQQAVDFIMRYFKKAKEEAAEIAINGMFHRKHNPDDGAWPIGLPSN